MKRFIAIIIALQMGLTPFCSAFAMESAQISIRDTGCASMAEETDLHFSHPTPHLDCCNTNNKQKASTQGTTSLDATSFAIQAHYSPSDTPNYCQASLLERIHFKHPPDDFERLSQSKRE